MRMIGGPCSMFGGRGEIPTELSLGKLKETVHLEDLDVDGSLILRLILKVWDWVGEDLILLAQDTGTWWAVVNSVMKLQVP